MRISASKPQARGHAHPVLHALLAASIGALVLGGAAQAAERPTACEVAKLAGSATLVRENQTQPLSPGVILYPRDQVVTAEASRLEIRCEDGSTIMIGDKSTVSLANLITSRRRSGWTGVLSLIEGIVRVTLSGTKAWDRFEVGTQTAVASARSTEWIVEAKPGTTGVFVAEGSVDVRSTTVPGQVVLTAGQGTDVKAGAAPTPPVPWGQPRIDGVRARTAPIP